MPSLSLQGKFSSNVYTGDNTWQHLAKLSFQNYQNFIENQIIQMVDLNFINIATIFLIHFLSNLKLTNIFNP